MGSRTLKLSANNATNLYYNPLIFNMQLNNCTIEKTIEKRPSNAIYTMQCSDLDIIKNSPKHTYKQCNLVMKL